MSYKKFKFISPGIFINEIDNSQLPALPDAIGPALIGRLERGPALKPVQVDSFADFIEVFGKPQPGGKGGDVFRYGNQSAPTYAAYAAQAWLRNNSPVTMVRLLGQTHKDATATTAYAGWATAASVADSASATDNNGAYGLFICESPHASTVTSSTNAWRAGTTFNVDEPTGTLAAIWYLTNGSIQLTGNVARRTGTSLTSSAFQFVRAVDTGPTFKVVVKNTGGTDVINSAFNFDQDSPKFIRKVFNTNPIKTNSDITTDTTNYWLGESFEGNLRTFPHSGTTGILGATAANTYGIIMRLSTPNGTEQGGDFRMSPSKSPNAQYAKTGWFIAQDLTSDWENYSAASQQKLFRFASRELGEETQRKIKISIKDLRAADPLDPNPYGSFSVIIRDIADTDASPVILEQYNNCNLDPSSTNYIARVIGNKWTEWSDTDRRYRTYGDFNNLSNYIYVQVHQDVDNGNVNDKSLPYGVVGHPRYVGWSVSGSGKLANYDRDATPAGATGAFVCSGAADPVSKLQVNAGSWQVSVSTNEVAKGKYKFPALRLREASTEGAALADPKDAYFGVDTTYNQSRFDHSVFDVIRGKCEDVSNVDAHSGVTEDAWVFSLDDVRNVNITSGADSDSYGVHATYEEGSRAAGKSYTSHVASNAAAEPGPSSRSWRNVIDEDYGGETAGWTQFTTLLHGGADGVDITESDPFRNSHLSGKSETTDASYNSLSVAIDSLRDPEVVEYNLLSAPGVTDTTLNNKMVDVCESRGDALAIIDLDGGYQPPHESKSDRVARRGNVNTVVKNKKNNLQVNSSYGCAYYPWVQIRDTINGVTLWAPPSVVAIGAMSYGEANSQLWFAPAGFTRGGLSANRAGGVPVVGVEEKLTVKQRDKLYENQINPIASFPAEGIVIFGQKTLQIQQSALDRINVRRLLIYLKKQVSRFAATILFDQNVDVTWSRFTSRVEPFLADVKAGLGLTDYKVVLDSTTTTPDLVDRNILYAKIFVKPARSIEYIAIDFIITNTGASFED
jgi:phage tail sheath protein FI